MCDVNYQTINNAQIIILHPLQHSNTVNRFSPLDLFTPFTANAASKLDVLGHDGDTLGVDGAEVGVFEKADEIGFGSMLQSKNRS